MNVSFWLGSLRGVIDRFRPISPTLGAVLAMPLVLASSPVGPATSAAAIPIHMLWSATSWWTGVRDQTYNYSIPFKYSGTVDHVNLGLPPYADAISPTVWSSMGVSGTVTDHGNYVTFTLTTKKFVGAGWTVYFSMSGITNPTVALTNTTMTATVWSTHGSVLTYNITYPINFYAPVPCPSSWPSIAAENSISGSTGWRLSKPSYGYRLSAWANKNTVGCGETLTLYIETTDADPHVQVDGWRMGYYGGNGARLVYHSTGRTLGFNQPTPRKITSTDPIDGSIRYHISADNWRRTQTFILDGRFAPGDYLFKLTSHDGWQTYVPLTVRNDSSHAKYLVQNSTMTWQAYNRWGGYSLYNGLNGSVDQGIRVTFDRPYGWDSQNGDGEFLAREYGFVWWAERRGLDIAYWTDNDLALRPGLLAQHKVLVLPGHTEYWTTGMRQTLDNAVVGGIDISGVST